MSAGAFEKIEGAKARKLLERVNRAWGGSPFDAGRTVVHGRSLLFAPDWMLVELGDATTMPEKRCTALDDGQESVPIEYNADFVPAFASRAGIVLDRDTAPDYLRFWFEYARAGADRFALVEAVDELPWREEPTPQARKSLAKIITPLTLTETRPDTYAFKACILFRDTLFDAGLEVSQKGLVRVVSRQVVAENLTVTDPLTGV